MNSVRNDVVLDNSYVGLMEEVIPDGTNFASVNEEYLLTGQSDIFDT